MTPGKDTSEYKLSVRSVAALLVTILGSIAASGLIPDDHLALKIITSIVALAGALGIAQVSSAYSKSRAVVKASEAGRALPTTPSL